MDFDLDCYKESGKICTNVLNIISDKINPGDNVKELCKYGDDLIYQKLNNIFKKITNKGISFPTSISFNNIAGYYRGNSIIPNDSLIHIELGTHINGFPTKCGKTIIIGNISNKHNKLIETVTNAGIKASKSFIQGKTTFDTKKIIKKIIDNSEFNIPYVNNPDYKIPGLFSNQMSRYILDSKTDVDTSEDEVHKSITHRDHFSYDFISQESEYDINDIFCVDLLFCSDDDKLIPTDEKVTLFKRDFDKRYNLKLKNSRLCLNSFTNKFVNSIDNFDTKKLSLGLKECTKNNLLIPYGTFKVKKGFISRFQFTVLVGKKKPIILTPFF